MVVRSCGTEVPKAWDFISEREKLVPSRETSLWGKLLRFLLISIGSQDRFLSFCSVG